MNVSGAAASLMTVTHHLILVEVVFGCDESVWIWWKIPLLLSRSWNASASFWRRYSYVQFGEMRIKLGTSEKQTSKRFTLSEVIEGNVPTSVLWKCIIGSDGVSQTMTDAGFMFVKHKCVQKKQANKQTNWNSLNMWVTNRPEGRTCVSAAKTALEKNGHCVYFLCCILLLY